MAPDGGSQLKSPPFVGRFEVVRISPDQLSFSVVEILETPEGETLAFSRSRCRQRINLKSLSDSQVGCFGDVADNVGRPASEFHCNPVRIDDGIEKSTRLPDSFGVRVDLVVLAHVEDTAVLLSLFDRTSGLEWRHWDLRAASRRSR